MRWGTLISLVILSLLAQGCLFGNGEGVGAKPGAIPANTPVDAITYVSPSSNCNAADQIGYASDNTITYTDGCSNATQTLTSSEVELSYLGAVATYQSNNYHLQTPVTGLDPDMAYTVLFCGNDTGYGAFVDTLGQGTLTQSGGSANFCTIATSINDNKWVFQNSAFSLAVDYLNPVPSGYPDYPYYNATLQISGTSGTQSLSCTFNQSSSPGPANSCQ
jgi:hypothetical protein